MTEARPPLYTSEQITRFRRRKDVTPSGVAYELAVEKGAATFTLIREADTTNGDLVSALQHLAIERGACNINIEYAEPRPIITIS